EMCWFTLSPAKSKKHHDLRSSDSSCAEEIVRVHRSPSRHRFTKVKVKVPSTVSMEMSEHHHHLHPHLHAYLDHRHRHHLHPLHLHPLHLHPAHGHHHHHDHLDRAVERLHGHGRRRCSPPPGPPPTRDPSRCRPRPRSQSPHPPRPCEPVYRTQIVEPSNVRETTRVALKSTQSEQQRGRLRRVAGYEVLGAQVPFDWDCISSTVGSSAAGGKWVRKKVKSSAMRHPPFGNMERWM
ncbi:hypothetical protein BDU57DRAFT_447609, partial [Ampelomyces quisqualis]